ncbi:MAG: CcmD family protein [Candidatus Eisenbacteria bacterium]
MIRRAGAILILLGALSLAGPVPNAAAQNYPNRPPSEERRSERRPANVSFLFAAFLITWVAIWGYLIAIHRGQRRLEKTLERMEKSRE